MINVTASEVAFQSRLLLLISVRAAPRAGKAENRELRKREKGKGR